MNNHHRCSPLERWPEYDARGIFLTYVCGQCRSEKLNAYRPDVLTNPNYDADEDIEPEETIFDACMRLEESPPPHRREQILLAADVPLSEYQYYCEDCGVSLEGEDTWGGSLCEKCEAAWIKEADEADEAKESLAQRGLS